MALDLGSPVRKWVALPTHRNWLLAAAGDLLDFFEGASVNPKGGFFDLDENRKPLPATPPADTGWPRGLHSTTRMVHCFAVAHLMGRPGAEAMIDHGMDFLWNGHRDTAHGGYFWSVGDNGPIEATKQAYGHAFVLLAASSAKVVGHPDADRLLDDVSRCPDGALLGR